MNLRFLFFLALLYAALANAQTDGRSKLDSILSLQDRRVMGSATLTRFLSDSDARIRKHAALACASLQDTTQVPALLQLLHDSKPELRRSAAFALGQSASLMVEGSRERVADTLIAAFLSWSGGDTRLLAEAGKIGSPATLNDLIRQLHGRLPQGGAMAFARFAIRGITSDGAERFLLHHAAEARPDAWEILYALQRAGDQPAVRDGITKLVAMSKRRDPLVRMNLAALLGKIAPGGQNALEQIATYDNDWRVRVNALKALGNPRRLAIGSTRSVLESAAHSANAHVAISAIASLGTGLPYDSLRSAATPSVVLLRNIAANANGKAPWQVQAEAAASLAAIEGPRAIPILSRIRTGEMRLRARIYSALGATRSPLVADTLCAAAQSGNPLCACAALEALQKLAGTSMEDALKEKVYAAALRALSTVDPAVITTAAALLADSLFARSGSIEPLTAALLRLRPPEDTEAMQQIIAALTSLKASTAIPALEKILASDDPSLRAASAEALHAITGRTYDVLPSVPLPVPDLEALHALSDTVNVFIKTSAGTIRVELYTHDAPFTVLSFVKLASEKKFFDRLVFHRVVPNFVVQGGDPRGDGWGGPGYAIRSEFSLLEYGTGAVGMASAGKDTEGSQFFITHSPQPHLDGRYTVLGRVVEGMAVVDALQVGDRILEVQVR